MLVWLNGPFGVGKTTTAKGLAEVRDDVRVFDPEVVGFMLRRFITEPVDDFQSWAAWRVLVAETAVQLVRHYEGSTVVAPMSLLHRPWAEEVHDRVDAAGVSQRHLLLHVDEPELRRRIETDEVETGAVRWRLDAIARYRSAREWLGALGPVIDTTDLTPPEVRSEVVARLHVRATP